MKFDVVAIVTQVASRIVGQVDANMKDYMDKDFKDAGVQDSIVQNELQWLLDYKVAEPQYEQLVNVILEHPEMQFCFNVCDMMVHDEMSNYVENEREKMQMQREYRRDVL